jgi:hypothetical protein
VRFGNWLSYDIKDPVFIGDFCDRRSCWGQQLLSFLSGTFLAIKVFVNQIIATAR